MRLSAILLASVIVGVLLVGCGGDAERIAELESQITDLQSQLAATTTSVADYALTAEERYWCYSDNFSTLDLCAALKALGLDTCPYPSAEMNNPDQYDFQVQTRVTKWWDSLDPDHFAQACVLAYSAR